MALNTLEIDERGPFVAGDIPEPIVMQFNRPSEQGGGPLTLTGYTDVTVFFRHGTGAWSSKTGQIHDDQLGKVKYNPVVGDFDDPGTYDILFQVASSTTTILTATKIVRLHFVDKDTA